MRFQNQISWEVMQLHFTELAIINCLVQVHTMHKKDKTGSNSYLGIVVRTILKHSLSSHSIEWSSFTTEPLEKRDNEFKDICQNQ